MEDKINILFVCKYNAFRSRVAEVYFNKINKNPNIKAKSSGIIGGAVVMEKQGEALKKCGMVLKRKSKGLSMDLLRWQNIMIIVADDVQPSLFNNKKYGKKLIVWKIRDTKDKEGKDIPKIVNKIKRKVDKLNKDIKEGRIR